MPSVYDSDNFRGRVDYAACVISRGGAQTRHFDTCFEMWDGDEVAVALLRRAERNKRLAARIFDYLDRATVTAAAERLRDVRDLAAQAAATRARRRRESDEWLAQIDAQRAAERAAGAPPAPAPPHPPKPPAVEATDQGLQYVVPGAERRQARDAEQLRLLF